MTVRTERCWRHVDLMLVDGGLHRASNRAAASWRRPRRYVVDATDFERPRYYFGGNAHGTIQVLLFDLGPGYFNKPIDPGTRGGLFPLAEFPGRRLIGALSLI